MKRYNILFLIFFPCQLFSQEVEQIIISNNRESYWKKINSIRKREIIEFKLINSSNQKYKRTQTILTEKYIQINDSVKEYIIIDRKKKSKKLKLNFDFLNVILNEADSINRNLTYNQLKIYLSNLKTQDIKSSLINSNNLYFTKPYIFSNEQIEDIKNLKFLDSFYRYSLKRNSFFIFDYTDLLEINIKTKQNEIEIHQNFTDNNGQPLIIYYKNPIKTYFEAYNPSINAEFKKILPKRSKLNDYFGTKPILHEYVNWYLIFINKIKQY